jgi:clan AA aspartic protease
VISGTVTRYREAVVRLHVRGPGGQEEEIEAVIDTGFSDFLTLAPPVIAALALQLAGSMRVTLADGGEIDLDAYISTVEWEGRLLHVSTLAADGGPLIGMSLFYGSELRVEVVDGGAVEIRALA